MTGASDCSRCMQSRSKSCLVVAGSLSLVTYRNVLRTLKGELMEDETCWAVNAGSEEEHQYTSRASILPEAVYFASFMISRR